MYDLIVIGAGAAGYEAALKARALDKKVLLVEKHKVGGTCLNYGCIPTKSLLYQTRKYKEIFNIKKYGIDVDVNKFDYSKILSNKNTTVSRLVKGIEFLLKKEGVDLIIGTAKLIDSNSIEVENSIYHGKNILICSGASEIILPIEGYENCISSKAFLEKDLSDVSNVVIIGGGVIGIELTTILIHLNINVTIFEAQEDVLSSVDQDAISLLKKDLRKEKVNIITNAKIEKIEQKIVYCDGKKYFCDFVISCVGRRPVLTNFDENNLLEKNDSFINVDNNFRTNIENIYAVGDCIKGIQLAHYAASCSKNVIEYLFGDEKYINLNTVANTIYCDKEISIVGASATNEDLVVKLDLIANSKSIIEDDNRGFFKLIFDENKYLKGAIIMCSKSSDMIAFFVNAINKKLKYEDIKENIYPHPSVIEILNNL